MKAVVILASLLFFVSPIMGVLVTLAFLIFRQYSNFFYLYFIGICSLFLGLINSEKVIESDLINYYIWFTDVSRFNFIQYLFYQGKEPVFFIYNYILYFLTSGSFKLYLICHTFICYFIVGYGLYKVHLFFNFSRSYFVSSLIVLYLFPNLFTLSVHLNRQFLAASILFLFIVQLTFNRKMALGLFFTAVFIHTSSVIYGFLYILKIISYSVKSSFVIFSVMIFTTVVLFNVLPAYIPSDLSDSIFGYGLERVRNLTESHVEFENLGVINYFLFSFIVIVFYFASKKLSFGLKLLFYFSLLILLFITLNFNNSEISLRFSFYLYFLFPLSIYFLPFIFNFRILDLEKWIIFPLLFTFSFWFVYKLEFGIWTYLNIRKVFFIGYW